MGTLDRSSIMAILIEYRLSCVKIPDRMSGIPITVWKNPVINPAAIPASSAISIASQTFHPHDKSITHTAPPVTKLPSTDKSAKFKIRYVI